MRIRTAALTDIGKVREENEDRFLCDDELRLYAVADGIGGLAGGAAGGGGSHRAAVRPRQHAVRPTTTGTSRRCFRDDQPARGQPWARPSTPLSASARRSPWPGCTTSGLHLAHVGDSSCYLWRDGTLEKLTLDHTVENEMQGAARPRRRHLPEPPHPECADPLHRPAHCTGSRPPDAAVAGRRPHPACAATASPASSGNTSWRSFWRTRRTRRKALMKSSRSPATAAGIDNATGVLIFVDSV